MPSSYQSNENDFPLYLFHQGKNYEAYKFFGAHAFRRGRGSYHRFRVWAPNGIAHAIQWRKSQILSGKLPFRI